MDAVFSDFANAFRAEDGYALATTLTPVAPGNAPNRLTQFYKSSNSPSIQTDVRYGIVYNSALNLPKAESSAWIEVFISYWKAIGELLAVEQGKGEWGKVYDLWKDVLNNLHRGYSNGHFDAWTIPCLYVGAKYLRNFAIKADEAAEKSKGAVKFSSAGLEDDIVGGVGQHDKLEDAARQINRMFSLCISDRAPLEESRKWGIYYMTNLLFKTYFKLNSISLSKNVLRTLQATRSDMPSLDAFPKSHQVTFKYYAGVIFFLEEDYAKAEEYLTSAWQLCHKDARRNRELILTYLIPCHLLTTHTLPTAALLEPYPRLQTLFKPLSSAIKRGDLAAFDAALQAGEAEFVKRRIYLTLERGRDIALRNLFRKVFIAGGYDPLKDGESEDARVRRTRVPVDEFTAAVRLGMKGEGSVNGGTADMLERDEVECLLANMIYKNLMKGYIARERAIVVLNKKGVFPGTGI